MGLHLAKIFYALLCLQIGCKQNSGFVKQTTRSKSSKLNSCETIAKNLENINLKVNSVFNLPLNIPGKSNPLKYKFLEDTDKYLIFDETTGTLKTKANISQIDHKLPMAIFTEDNQDCAHIFINVLSKDTIVIEENSTFGAKAKVYDLGFLVSQGGSAKLPNFDTLKIQKELVAPNFNYPNVSWETGFPGLPNLKSWFGIRFSAQLDISKSGKYDFKMVSDDGGNLYIDKNKVIDLDGIHPAKTGVTSLNLTEGNHDLRIDWFQGPPVWIHLELYWKKPGDKNFEIIPTSSLLVNE